MKAIDTFTIIALVAGAMLGATAMRLQAWAPNARDLDTAIQSGYTLGIRAAAANVEQVLNVKAGANEPVTVQVPNTSGLWGTTPAAEIKLAAGPQTLRISAPFQRGVAVQYLALKSRN
ncbi:MAG: hypothetical protein NTW21_38080 [Verrucomicrobia bacterium]|nr:hypothetical protein [Verrucomicrobiota bacterium]